jgi:hypothetical protein
MWKKDRFCDYQQQGAAAGIGFKMIRMNRSGLNKAREGESRLISDRFESSATQGNTVS